MDPRSSGADTRVCRAPTHRGALYLPHRTTVEMSLDPAGKVPAPQPFGRFSLRPLGEDKAVLHRQEIEDQVQLESRGFNL